MSTKLTAVAIEAADVRALARFWREALRWQFAEINPTATELLALRPASTDGVYLFFAPSNRPKINKNRLHLDLAAGSSQAREVRRLLALGALRADIGQGEVPWEVMADPERNEFCVVPHAESADPLVAICLDAADPGIMGRFWATATGWAVAAQGDWGVGLNSSAGNGPVLTMGPPVAPKSGMNRLQLVLMTAPKDDMAAVTARLLDAGASRVGPGRPDGEQQMLADPEGNEFIVINPRLKSAHGYIPAIRNG
jgi:predicted enzyme related to lactoylglutathione lyase